MSSCSHIVSEEVEKYMDFGGIRLEDNIVITQDGVDNLTNVPRRITELQDVVGSGYR